jgi:hypothetical protein
MKRLSLFALLLPIIGVAYAIRQYRRMSFDLDYTEDAIRGR